MHGGAQGYSQGIRAEGLGRLHLGEKSRLPGRLPGSLPGEVLPDVPGDCRVGIPVSLPGELQYLLKPTRRNLSNGRVARPVSATQPRGESGSKSQKCPHCLQVPPKTRRHLHGTLGQFLSSRLSKRPIVWRAVATSP
jgi:hypothetical protein